MIALVAGTLHHQDIRRAAHPRTTTDSNDVASPRCWTCPAPRHSGIAAGEPGYQPIDWGLSVGYVSTLMRRSREQPCVENTAQPAAAAHHIRVVDYAYVPPPHTRCLEHGGRERPPNGVGPVTRGVGGGADAFESAARHSRFEGNRISWQNAKSPLPDGSELGGNGSGA
jgi:hypothetical protein